MSPVTVIVPGIVIGPASTPLNDHTIDCTCLVWYKFIWSCFTSDILDSIYYSSHNSSYELIESINDVTISKDDAVSDSCALSTSPFAKTIFAPP